MCDLVARTGRHQQRYEAGCRLVAGCIPFRFRSSDKSGNADTEKIVELLMINSTSGPGLLFPKGGWENDETVQEAAVREAIEEAGVRGDLMEELESWPEMSTRTRTWLTVPEAVDRCRHSWMRDALENGFSKWYAERAMNAGEVISEQQ